MNGEFALQQAEPAADRVIRVVKSGCGAVEGFARVT